MTPSSSTGSFVNGLRVTDKALSSGDKISLGHEAGLVMTLIISDDQIPDTSNLTVLRVLKLAGIAKPEQAHEILSLK